MSEQPRAWSIPDVVELVARLRHAAAGRREYARGAGKDADLLEHEAFAFDSAARLIQDADHMRTLVPTWMPYEPGGSAGAEPTEGRPT